MWEPELHWERLRSGLGGSTVGVWRDGDLVVKRLQAPLAGDPDEFTRPDHFAWWRRPVEVATSRVVEHTPGLRAAPAVRVEEDGEGVTLWHRHVERESLPALFVARSLGRFTGADLGGDRWLATGQLADRVARVERRSGWRTLARTTVADVADRLWQRRGHWLRALADMPHVPQHGDPVPDNLVSREGDDVIAIDWATLGTGPLGADLGYWALSAHESFEALLSAYLEGVPQGLDTDGARTAAQVTAVYTALTRADWALARVVDQPGALAGKFRHPAVAPYLRDLQRQFTQIEALI